MSHTIRVPHQEVEDLQSVFGQFFSNQQGAPLAVWMLANKEMNLDAIAKCVSPFKNNAKKVEFQQQDFDYTHYKIGNADGNSDEVREMGTDAQLNFVARFKEEFAGRLEGLAPPTKHLLQTGIQEEMNKLLFELKGGEGGNGEMKFEEPVMPKTEYLKQLIEKILEKFFKDSEEGLPEKIITYGGIQPVLATALLSSDASFRGKFKNILYSCKTFNDLRLYGGRDITEEKRKLVESISTCLIELKFAQKTAQQICKQLLEKPVSNIVALREDLTNKQKEKYYNSEFYRKGELKAYAQISDYANSLDYKVKEDVTKVLAVIEDLAKNSKETVDNVLAFNFYGLLKINTIKHIKRNVYQAVINECPNFLKAFKMVKYQGKSPASLRENERINQKMDLIDVFFKIKLPYEQWEKAESKILSRDYGVIEDLTLKFDAKHKLVEHIIKKVQPYFHKGEKQMDYRSEVEHSLLEMLMDTEIGESNNFDTILNIISQTLDSETNYTSELVSELAKGQIRAYTDVLKKCSPFNEYKASKGRDIKEEQYTKSWELKQQIYENNLEDRVDVTYQAIDDFIKKVIEDGGKIPKTYTQHITDLSKLRGDPIEQIVEVKDIPDIIDNIQEIPPIETKEELNKKFTSTADKLVKAFIDENEESIFEKMYVEKFGKNAVSMVKKIVEANAFGDPNSAFFSDLALNNLLNRRIKGEFANNAGKFSGDVNECTNLLRKLAQSGSSSNIANPSSPLKPPVGGESKDDINKKFTSTADKLVKAFIDANEESIFEKMYTDKFGKNAASMVKKIVETNAFDNPNSAFFSDLALNNLLNRRIKAEFVRTSALVSADLNECASLLQRL